MITLTMTTSDLGLLSPRDAALLKSAHSFLWVLARSFAALIVLTALLAPDCCLTGTHVHSANPGGFGPICFSGVGWR
jgi:hypothetical protein